MNIIVFGGSGFLGSHVSDKLSDAGHKVKIFDQNPSQWLRKDQEMILGSTLNEPQVFEAVKGADIVFNFSGIADIDENMKRPIDSVKHNILGNTIILEACKQSKIKRYIFASSIYVYSRNGGFYRCSKQACEQYIEGYQEAFGLDYTILRYGSLYGPRSDKHNAIFSYIKQALTENKITYQGNADALREYIHVEDAALANVDILQSKYTNQNIVLAGHQQMKVGNLFKMISDILGKNIEINFLEKPDNIHYAVTPYSFNPKIGKKLIASYHIDLGQGILREIETIHRTLYPETHNTNEVSLKEKSR